MKLIIFLSSLFIFNSAVLQCSNDEQNVADEPIIKKNAPCNIGELPSTSLEKYFNCSDTRYSLNLNLKESHHIIHSQAEFNQLATSSCEFNIDFTYYDLIIGKKQLTSGNQSINYEYTTTDCITKKLKVIFIQDNTLFAPNITYHRLVPKISTNEILEVELVGY